MKIQPGCRRRSFWRSSRQNGPRYSVDSHQLTADSGERSLERKCQCATQKQNKQERLAHLSTQLSNELGAALTSSGAASAALPQILHIDPDVNIAVMLSDALEPEIQVHHSRTIAEARHLLTTEAFNLVIIDPDFPDCDVRDLRALLAGANGNAGNTALLILSNRAASRADDDAASLRMIKSRTSSQHLLATVQSLIGEPG